MLEVISSIRRVEIAAIILTLISFSIQAQEGLRNYLSQREKLDMFGGSVLIMIKGKPILNEGFGLADYENSIPNSNTTVHRIGSLTKPMTAMAALRLLSLQKDLALADSLGKFLNDVPAAWSGVTLFHLLSHTSGIPDFFGDLEAVPVEDTGLEIRKVFKQQKNTSLKSKPGEVYAYSNFGYILVGYIMEIVTGKKYSEVLLETVLSPLQMVNTFYDDPRKIIKNRAQGYQIKNGVRVNDALKDPAAYSAGGLLSTTDDLVKWSKALSTDIILPASYREQMFTPYRGAYGMGWQIIEKKGRKMYNHNGGTHGFNSRLVYYPADDIFIAVLGNNEDVRAAGVTCDLEALIFKEADHTLAISIQLTDKDLGARAGDFTTSSGKVRKIEFKEGNLYYVNGESSVRMVSLAKNEFCLKGFEDIRIQFVETDKFVISFCSTGPEEYHRK